MRDRNHPAPQAYLAAIVESSTDAVLSMDLSGAIRSGNPSSERMYGYTAEELIGRPIYTLIPPERHAEEREILARIRRGERVEHFETVRVTKDGRKLDVSLSVSPIRDAAGTIIGIAKVARDITEQKRLERELAAQREWFRVTLASIGDAVIATDVQGRVSFMNSVAAQLTGWRVEDALGEPYLKVFNIVNEQTGMAIAGPLERVLAEGTIVGLANHTALIAADGTERPIEDSGAPIRDRDGRILGTVLVFRDASERRRADTERRSVAIERERLLEAERAARAEAERANRVKDEFVAMVSHELRTPLNAILGWTQLMMQSRADPDVIGRGLDVIARNTRLQAQLISDLLDMSRIVSGKLRLSIEKVELRALLEDAVESVERAAVEKNVAIQCELAASSIVAGDPSRIQQIVWNLLWNAIKFTPAGGRVLVRLRQRAANAEITIADTGVGIAPELLPSIFDRFQQGNVSITRRFGGLGLGLAIVRHLVDLHGGTIRADSPGEGRGATFTVVLPSSALAPTMGAHDSALDSMASPTDMLAGVRVLVVEDEADTRDFLRRFLTDYGAEVITARSATEALALVQQARPSLLVSDIGLPDVDGYELLRRIRVNEPSGARNIPAIALTAYARSEDRDRAFSAGYDAHLAKPIEAPLLLAAAVDLLKEAATPDGALASRH
jgi:PAS domain S-box-containing protein